MAATKHPTRKKSALSNAVVAQEHDPQSWLFLNPNGASAVGTVFGVLRKTYGGKDNTAAAFGWHKANPAAPPGAVQSTPWTVTAERLEVLLPDRADDALSDPESLLRQMDSFAVPHEKALLVYLTLPLGDVDRVHVGWERCRTFARTHLVEARGLATLLILHAPGSNGSANPLHCHCLIVPRRISGLGLRHGAYDTELTNDGGQAIIERLWTAHLEEFR